MTVGSLLDFGGAMIGIPPPKARLQAIEGAAQIAVVQAIPRIRR